MGNMPTSPTGIIIGIIAAIGIIDVGGERSYSCTTNAKCDWQSSCTALTFVVAIRQM
jgi:hypothetical protein